ncbi:MAG TPA: hypothetical protein ENJ09_11760 [Planctomycetes bacterium]|nr:hypothetical protein [Planctomycetota bacterium]
MSYAPDSGRFRALLLTGTAHCGSTLLGRMLAMHSRAICLGEVLRMGDAIERGFACSCGEALGACPFWSRYAELFRSYATDWRRYDLAFLDAFARGEERDLIVDLSKTRVWRSRRAWKRGEAARLVGFVFQLRDSRGVMAAAKRAGHDVAHAAERHAKWVKRLDRFADKERARTFRTSYEALCADPEGRIRELMNWLELDFEPRQLEPSDRVHHLVHASASSYLAGSNEIRRDERWRTELDPAEIALIERQMERVPILRTLYLDPSAPEYVYRD